MAHLTSVLKMEIESMLKEVETLFEIGYEEEVDKVGELVDEYQAVFTDERVILKVYKEQMSR